MVNNTLNASESPPLETQKYSKQDMFPRTACFVVVTNNDKYLLIQEGTGSNKGLWSLPGGHVNQGETLEEAAVRECLEEAGVTVELIDKIVTKVLSSSEYAGVPEESDSQHEVTIYKARYVSGIPKPGPEELDASWFTIEQMKQLRLRFGFLISLLN